MQRVARLVHARRPVPVEQDEITIRRRDNRVEAVEGVIQRDLLPLIDKEATKEFPKNEHRRGRYGAVLGRRPDHLPEGGVAQVFAAHVCDPVDEHVAEVNAALHDGGRCETARPKWRR
jgi:hypothetical protein